MKTLNLIQGTPEWHAHRAAHFNASDAPAMMGVSSYQTRTELLDRLKTGITPEVDPATQRRFDDGHRFEALARPLAEAVIGEELYPVTGTEEKYSASFDGITMMETVSFEHKSLNDRIRAAQTAADLPIEYLVQVEHQFLVCPTIEKCLFMATRWEGDKCAEKREFWIEPNLELRAKVVAGWARLEEDLRTHQPEAKKVEPVGVAPDALPALHIEVTSLVKASNLDKFAEHALTVFSGINTDLQTDDDFANADKTAKWCREVEARIAATEEQIIGQSQDVESVFRALRSIKEEARQKALLLEKAVKSKKESIKTEAVMKAQADISEYVSGINSEFGAIWLKLPPVNFGEAIKGLKTISSLKDRIATTLATSKAEADVVAERIKSNVLIVGDSMHLFPDFAQHCTTEPALFSALIDQRKAQYQARIDAEAQAKAVSESAIASAQAAVQAHPSVQGNVIPAEFSGTRKATQSEAVIDAEPRIAAFLNSREWPKGKANEYRAVLVEFFKFEAKEAA